MATTKVSKHEVASVNSYFFDANIWLYLFAPIHSYELPKQEEYARLLSNIKSRNATIFLSSLVVSEFINRRLRMGFDQWKDSVGDSSLQFKRDYRNTTDYKETLEEAQQSVLEILKVATKRSDEYADSNFQSIKTWMGKGCDFNDAYYIMYCRKNSFKFVTDDHDISSQDIGVEVITF